MRIPRMTRQKLFSRASQKRLFRIRVQNFSRTGRGPGTIRTLPASLAALSQRIRRIRRPASS
jgi:hypothetical protein